MVSQFGPINITAGIISRVTLEELSLQAEALEEALRGARHDEVVLVPLGVQAALQMLKTVSQTQSLFAFSQQQPISPIYT